MLLQQLARKSLLLAPNLQHMTIHSDSGQRWRRTAKAFTLYMWWWRKVDCLWLRNGFALLNCSGFQRNDYILMHCAMIFSTISSCSKCHPDALGLQCMISHWPHPSCTHKWWGDSGDMQKWRETNWSLGNTLVKKIHISWLLSSFGNNVQLWPNEVWEPTPTPRFALIRAWTNPFFSGIHSSLWKHEMSLDNVSFFKKHPTQRSWLRS